MAEPEAAVAIVQAREPQVSIHFSTAPTTACAVSKTKAKAKPKTKAAAA
jgi:hypothetical protein